MEAKWDIPYILLMNFSASSETDEKRQNDLLYEGHDRHCP